MTPSPSERGVLVHAPRSRSRVAEALDGLGPITFVERRTELLAALAEEPDAWRVVVLALDDAPDLALATRVVERLPHGLVVATHPQPTMERVIEAETAGIAFLLPELPEPARLRSMLEPYLLEDADHPVPAGAGEDEEAVVGTSAALMDAYRTVARVARSAVPVLVSGDSGTGKELVARALHRRSDRHAKPFVAVNCAALPEGLLEAELFGYERGAFTGAVGRSDGRFGRAHGGTLFLDEIGEMGPGLQAKLLRALESGEIERLGTVESIRVDVRVVAATNRDLDARVREGAFREDLLYRLAVVRVALPSLSERPEDLVPLVEAFVARFAGRHGRPVHALSAEALRELRERSWPGNVRELRNVLDRAVLLARGGVVRSVDLAGPEDAPRLSPAGDDGGYAPTLSLREVEERHIRRVLAHTRGHLGEAAEILGVHRNTMTVKVREYGIDPQHPQDRNPGYGGR